MLREPARSRRSLAGRNRNRSYAEFAVHYGKLVDPARAAKPKDKAQVERPMPYVRGQPWNL